MTGRIDFFVGLCESVFEKLAPQRSATRPLGASASLWEPACRSVLRSGDNPLNVDRATRRRGLLFPHCKSHTFWPLRFCLNFSHPLFCVIIPLFFFSIIALNRDCPTPNSLASCGTRLLPFSSLTLIMSSVTVPSELLPLVDSSRTSAASVNRFARARSHATTSC